MRRAYDESLQELHREFYQLGRYVNEAIYKAVKAFTEHDKQLAQEVIDDDMIVNQLEHRIEQKCVEIIALQSPVATDLRKIITVLKASADLERMGDHATNIAQSTIRVKGNKHSGEIEGLISETGAKVNTMGQGILDAFIRYDDQMARYIALQDDEIDDLSFKIKQKSIELMKQDPEIIIGATDYTLISSNLERIGDYITNIGEWIVYYKTGEIAELDGPLADKDMSEQ